ncbi:hypothetical protein C8F01DRAFT_367757 [Mycena amicta]|nr:hypothetical protein C8F01DRAFT_367757 [Mycena amicta]
MTRTSSPPYRLSFVLSESSTNLSFSLAAFRGRTPIVDEDPAETRQHSDEHYRGELRRPGRLFGRSASYLRRGMIVREHGVAPDTEEGNSVFSSGRSFPKPVRLRSGHHSALQPVGVSSWVFLQFLVQLPAQNGTGNRPTTSHRSLCCRGDFVYPLSWTTRPSLSFDQRHVTAPPHVAYPHHLSETFSSSARRLSTTDSYPGCLRLCPPDASAARRAAWSWWMAARSIGPTHTRPA